MNMKQLRLRANKRAEEIAADLGVAISTVRNWEQMKFVPRMTPKDMKKLMNCYNCTFEELVEAEEEMEKEEK
jgi:putative transcriptional regulator